MHIEVNQPQFFGKKKISIGFIAVVVIFLCYCLLLTPNFLITIPVALYPLFAFRLLWTDKQPNVLFFGMMIQWLVSSIHLLYCDIYQITLYQYFINSSFPADQMENSLLLSTIAVYFFTGGLFLAIRKIPIWDISNSIKLYSPRKILLLYIVVTVFIYFTSALIWGLKAFVQYAYFFYYIQWGFFMVAFYTVHKNSRNLRWTFYAILVIQFILGLVSFFASSFLTVIEFGALGLVMIQPKLNIRAYIFLTLMCLLIFRVGIIWTAVKEDYRGFLNKGTLDQAVSTSRGESLQKLGELVDNLKDADYEYATIKTIDRLGNINFFAATLNYVPRVLPYENGAIYLSAVQHYLVPRFLNSDKAVLDDSKHTNKYTGMQFGTAEEGVSFSLGYIPDAYIDFGPINMFLVIFLFGYLFGLTFKFLYNKSPNVFWAWILTSPYFILININGADTKKALGPLLIYFLVVAILRKYIIKIVDRFIVNEAFTNH